MKLLVDIGNSRIKWALLRGSRPGAQQALSRRGDDGAELRRVLRGAVPGTQVLAVNVAGRDAERALRAAARAAGLAAPRMLRSSRAAAGVRSGYREAWRLGADRWAALLGARALLRQAACVVSIGTAMTVDFLDRQGRHRGGYIVPGPTLMVRSLLTGTRGIRQRARGGGARRGAGGSGWPRRTRDALDQGALEACAAMATRSLAQARVRLGPGTRLLLTGGGAKALAGRLPRTTRIVPDLTLRGLVAWDAAADD